MRFVPDALWLTRLWTWLLVFEAAHIFHTVVSQRRGAVAFIQWFNLNVLLQLG